MSGIGKTRLSQFHEESQLVARVLETTPTVDKHFAVSREEFENTLGKFGTRVECFNQVPINVQSLIGSAEMG